MQILLLSAYTAQSHQYWIDSLRAMFPEHQWTVLSLPARYFSWRIRGNSLSWAFSERETLEKHYDLVIATSMVDLSALRGFVPALTTIPTLVYFHENQFAYPASAHQRNDSVEPQILNLYTALAADVIVFNSDYNRCTFLDGVATLLKKLPDFVPVNIANKLEEISRTLAVPLMDPPSQLTNRKPHDTTFHIVWNHRWEYDKGIDQLLACLKSLPDSHSLTVHIIGQRFRQAPETMQEVKTLLEDRGWLGEWGFIDDRVQYLHLLDNSHVVLSTALHDFQGLAVLEACLHGCWPVVPDRLAYQEFIPDHCRYISDLNKGHNEATSAAQVISALYDQWVNKSLGTFSDERCNQLTISQLKPRYESLINAVAAQSQ